MRPLPQNAGQIANRRRVLLAGSAGLLGLGGLGLARWQEAWGALSPWAGLRVLDERETRFGRLAVVERGRTRYLAYGPGARLVYQSAIDLDQPEALAAPYMRLMMLGLVYAEQCSSVLQIGVGAGNMAGYVIRNFPAVVVDAVDIDSNAVELGIRWFGLEPGPRLRLHEADGRAWLAASQERFDVVMLDAYDDRSIPASLMDREFFSLVASRTAPGGVVMQNVFMPQVDTAALLASLKESFAQVDFYRVGDSAVLAAYQEASREPSALMARARQIDAALRPLHSLAVLLEYRVETL
jgi:spermidine synthase